MSTQCITNAMVGKVLTLQNTASGGFPGDIYDIIFLIDGVELSAFYNVPESVTKTIQYTVVAEDIPSIRLGSKVTHYCPGDKQSVYEECIINISSSLPICDWIIKKGGIHSLTIPYIFELIYAYQGFKDIGFVPTIKEIMGCIYYFLGYTDSGNTNTGCNF